MTGIVNAVVALDDNQVNQSLIKLTNVLTKGPHVTDVHLIKNHFGISPMCEVSSHQMSSGLKLHCSLSDGVC